ncbi:MAG: hypothetical protein AAFR58_10735 [Cyanobacteria bacterium J06627_28]
MPPTKKLLQSIWEPIDAVGSVILGDLWPTFYQSVQDAIALSLLLRLPSGIGLLIIGKSYSGFDACLRESGWGVNRYACFIIVGSDFLLWVVLAGRIIGRFLSDIQTIKFRKK